MADWDADSTRLTHNISRLMESSVWKEANRRKFPSAQEWHTRLMQGLDVPNPDWVGAYRGAPGLETIEVQIDDLWGTPANEVVDAVARFETILRQAFADLDDELPRSLIDQPQFTHSDVQLFKVIELCAWVHAEWVRIHPLANGNGRIARIWANYIAVRYGLPAFVRIRPRPDPQPYGAVGRLAIQGDWLPTVALFQRMLREYLGG
jgi:fido (protein-threonine AMPylation protein)